MPSMSDAVGPGPQPDAIRSTAMSADAVTNQNTSKKGPRRTTITRRSFFFRESFTARSKACRVLSEGSVITIDTKRPLRRFRFAPRKLQMDPGKMTLLSFHAVCSACKRRRFNFTNFLSASRLTSPTLDPPATESSKIAPPFADRVPDKLVEIRGAH